MDIHHSGKQAEPTGLAFGEYRELRAMPSLAPIDEFDVGGRMDLQPLENRRQALRNTAALALDHCPAGKPFEPLIRCGYERQEE